MYNMLLIEEKPELALIISNYISKNFNFIRTYAISTNLNEALDILSNEIPDLIIVNYDSLQNSINNVFNYMEKYKNSLILFSHKNILSQKILKNPYIASYVLNYSTPSQLYIPIKLYLSNIEKINNFKLKINNELLRLHYNFSYIAQNIYQNVYIYVIV